MNTQSDQEKQHELCKMTVHHWKEEYYGYRCENCGDLIPFGCEPWAPLDDNGDVYREDGYDESGEPDFTLDDLEWDEAYPELNDDSFCPHCGKEFEDWSDYGCPNCDKRV